MWSAQAGSALAEPVAREPFAPDPASGAASPSPIDETADDERLMEQVQAGEAAALETLYTRHRRAALALASRIVGDRASAEDVVQEAFLAAWRRAPSYDSSRGQPRRWLLSIVHHRCVDRLRRSAMVAPGLELDDDLVDRSQADVFEQANLSVEREAIRRALAMIPPEQREAIELAYFGGHTQQEIAVHQGVPLGTVKGRLRIGLHKLRTLLEPAVRHD